MAKYEKSLEFLQPHANLKALRVHRYLGMEFPSWVPSLVNLVELELYACSECWYLPPLHVLTCLQNLKLSWLDSLEYIDDDQNTSSTSSGSSCDKPFFPSLKKLRIQECPKLTSMPLFPYLESLSLDGISSKPLIQIMNKNASYSCSVSSSSSFQPLPKLVEMSIEDIGDLQSLLQQAMAYLSSLQSLIIGDCPNLNSLPEAALGNLSSLQSLEIIDCPNFNSLPEAIGNLPSLQSITIKECPNLKSLIISRPSNLPRLRLTIENCHNLESLDIIDNHLSHLQQPLVARSFLLLFALLQQTTGELH